MKVLQKVILGLGLVIGSVYAQNVSNTIPSLGYIKDYTVIIKLSDSWRWISGFLQVP